MLSFMWVAPTAPTVFGLGLPLQVHILHMLAEAQSRLALLSGVFVPEVESLTPCGSQVHQFGETPLYFLSVFSWAAWAPVVLP